MKTRLFCLIILLKSFSCYSQDVDVTNLIKLTLINPGLSCELKVGKLQTIYVQPFLKTSFHATGKSYILIPYDTHVDYYFDPAISGQFRQYYLTKKQKRQSKDHRLNQMNYVALYEEIFFSKKPFYQKVSSRRAYNRIAVVWGTQRNLTKRLSCNLNLGYGYFFPIKPFYYSNGEKMEETLRDAIVAQVNIGWLLRSKRN